MNDDPFGFRAMFEAQCALSLMQIELQRQRYEVEAMQRAADAARMQAQFEENCRLHDAMDPNLIDLGPDDVREIKNLPLLTGPKDME